MKNNAGYKIKLFLAIAITAVVLCALPFLAYEKKKICVYPSSRIININEKAFISALKDAGYQVIVAPQQTKPSDIAFWFRKPEQVDEVILSQAKYNFMYSPAHYPLEWSSKNNLPIVITPHQDLYEHYVRSNIKTALLEIKTDTAQKTVEKITQILVWLQENQTN